jgi:type IV pilus assembly protein PilV
MMIRRGFGGSFSVPHRGKGFTLLEVLVALLVLSIGLLGLAGLQTFSLRNNHSAFLRSQAVSLAYDAIDRMRSNRADALNVGSTFNTFFDDTEATPDCSSNCTVVNMAQHQVGAWKNEVARLPGGKGQVTIVNGRARVQVRWTDNRDATPSEFTVDTLL